jgi:hypothetical protein
MPIDLGSRPRRRTIAWFRDTLPQGAVEAFVGRDFRVEQCADAALQSDEFLAGTCAVVFSQNPNKPNDVPNQLRRFGRRLLDYDCSVVIRPARGFVPLIARAINDERLHVAGLQHGDARAEVEILRQWQRTDRGDPARPHLRIYGEFVKWSTIANYEMEHPPGPAPSPDLKIHLAGEAVIDESANLLIRRAFGDCVRIDLTPLADGRSGVGVFLAHAERAAAGTGRWPLPFFVKVGDRAKILSEYENYDLHVKPYIPFHLGPNLDLARCHLGAHSGILVGDFVEEAESLFASARDGRAAGAISCLFERTLRGWHRHVEDDPRALSRALRFPNDVAPERVARARKLGAKATMEELRGEFALCESTPVLMGPVHGDLHGANVIVRGSDAIVIDFLQTRRGALLRDPAALEASLLVGSYAPDEVGADFVSFCTSVDALYRDGATTTIPLHSPPRDRWSWFHSAVRQIRVHALHMEREPGQYSVALGVALLFKASVDSEAKEPEASRRALAYALGERALRQGLDRLKSRPTTSARAR